LVAHHPPGRFTARRITGAAAITEGNVTSRSGAAVLHGFTDLVGACADDADRDDLRAAGARLGLKEARARPEWLPAGRASHRVAVVTVG
jgi:hypothetical protein